MQKETIKAFCDLIFKMYPQARIYVRNLNTKGNKHGIFSSTKSLLSAVSTLPEDTTLYFNAQTLSEEFINNTPLEQFGVVTKNSGLKRNNIVGLNYFVIDIDVRNIDNCVLDSNKHFLASLKLNENVNNFAVEIKKHLEDCGYEHIYTINSGNGAYVFIPIENDLQKDIETVSDLWKKLISALNIAVQIDYSYQFDTSVNTPEHLFKLPGTLSKKGIETDTNKYRYATFKDSEISKKTPISTIAEYVRDKGVLDSFVTINSKGKTVIDTVKCLMAFENSHTVFRDQFNTCYCLFQSANKTESHNMDSELFNVDVRNYLRQLTSLKIIDNNTVLDIVTYMKDLALTSSPYTLCNRIKYDIDNATVYYDCGDSKQTIQIKPNDITIIKRPYKTFLEQPMDTVQVLPNLSSPPEALKELLPKYFNITNKRMLLLFMCYLGCCFLGNSYPSPILFFTGEKGSSKSTATRFIQAIVSPQKTGLSSLPKNEDDIAVMLSKRLMTTFDNLGGIKESISNLLCMTTTGGTKTKRKLYTDSEEVQLDLKSILILNGIDILAGKADLLDRTLIFDLTRIATTARKSEKELNNSFRKDLPNILGSLFNALANVLALPDPTITDSIRLADFQLYATKFAIAFGHTQQDLEYALKENQLLVNQKVVESQPVALCIAELMSSRTTCQRSVSELFNEVCDIADALNIDRREHYFPKSPSAFSLRIKEVASNLESLGITFEINNVGTHKEIILTKTPLPSEGFTPISEFVDPGEPLPFD